MKLFSRIFIICVLIVNVYFISIINARVESTNLVPVEIFHDGRDQIGTKLVYQIKEIIRQTSGLRLTNSNENRIVVHILTMELECVKPGTLSIYGYTIAAKGKGDYEILLYHSIGACGSKFIDSQAKQLVAVIDEQAEHLPK